MTLTQIKPAGLSKPVDLADNEKIRLGTDNDIEVFFDGTDLKFRSAGDTTLSLIADTGNNDESSVPTINFFQDGGVNLLRIGVEGMANESLTGSTANTPYITATTGHSGMNLDFGTADTVRMSLKDEGLFPATHNLYDFGDASTRWAELYATHVDIPDNGKLRIGNSDDLQIYHNSTDSWFYNTTGNLYIRQVNGGTIYLQPYGGENGIIVNPNADVELYHNNVKRIETTSTGFDAIGTQFKFSDAADTKVIINADTDNDDEEHNPTLDFVQDGTTKVLDLGIHGLTPEFTDGTHNNAFVRVGGHGNVGLEIATSGGAGNAPTKRLTIDYNGNVVPNGTNNYDLGNSSNRFRDIFVANGVDLSDNGMLRLGTSDDIRIWHDGTNSHFQNQTGELKVRANNVQFRTKLDDETLADFNANGNCELYYDNVKKLETTADGATINGVTVSTGNIQINNDTGKIRLGASQDLQIYHDGSDSIIKGLGTGSLVLESAVTNEHLQVKAGVNGDFRAYVNNGTLAMICNAATQNAELRCGGTKRFETTSTGFDAFGTQFKVSDAGDVKFIINADTDNHDESHNPLLEFQQDGSTVMFHVGAEGAAGAQFTNSTANTAILSAPNAAHSGNVGIEFATRDTRRMRINPAGVIDGDFNDTSDGNLKENITSIGTSIDKIKSLRPVNFDWKDPTREKNYSGFIAQELKTIYPNLVHGEEHTEAEPWKMYSVQTAGLLAHVTKALQEAIAKIETLETEVAALKAK